MNLGILFCLLLAHFIADFPLQSEKIVQLRNSTDLKCRLLGIGVHMGVHLLVLLALTIYFWSLDVFFIVLIIVGLHGVIDYIKLLIILRYPFKKHSVGLFLADQGCHLVSVFFVLYTVNRNPSVWSSMVWFKNELTYFFNISLAAITYYQRLILSLVLLTIGLWGVGIFIRIVLNNMSLRPYQRAINLKIEVAIHNKSEGAARGGFIIGLLERLFIILSIVLDMPIVIGFILTVKSVARLKKFDDDRFVEIFIIGSFISFISAIVIGYTIKLLKILPY